MAWRNCAASLTLIAEINDRWPGRDRASDGTIGDAAHATRTSDHNPWVVVDGTGVVRARDIDKDGIDAPWLAEFLRRRGEVGDLRLAGGGYVIFNRRITTPNFSGWKAYTGSNPHTAHLHVSFSRNRAGFDSTAAWGITDSATPTTTAPTPAPQEDDMNPEQNHLLVELHRQLVTGPDPGRWGWDTWDGGSTRTDGTRDRFTTIDYLRKANQVAEDNRRDIAALRGTVESLATARAEAPAIGLTADDVRTILREALADLGPLHLTTTKETP